MATWLNQSKVEEMETYQLIGWRDNLVSEIARISVFLSQVEHELEQRAPKEAA